MSRIPFRFQLLLVPFVLFSLYLSSLQSTPSSSISA